MDVTTSPARSPRVLAGVLLAAAGLGCLAGCRSGPEESEPFPALEFYRPRVQPDQMSIGMLLAEIDREVLLWSQLTLSARTENDRKKARGIELNLTRIAKPRILEIIEQLETGPPLNRQRAAAALGFTQDAAAQAPLLAALHDSQDDVVNNALISLGTLQRADTPLGDICELTRTHPGSFVRSNAARALLWIVHAGGREDCVLGTARSGIADPEPAVRAQCLLLLGILEDGTSVNAIADQLFDEHPFVTRAATEALVGLAQRSEHDRGPAVRALVSAYDRLESDRRPILRGALARVRGVDLGEDVEPWVEWARNLP